MPASKITPPQEPAPLPELLRNESATLRSRYQNLRETLPPSWGTLADRMLNQLGPYLEKLGQRKLSQVEPPLGFFDFVVKTRNTASPASDNVQETELSVLHTILSVLLSGKFNGIYPTDTETLCLSASALLNRLFAASGEEIAQRGQAWKNGRYAPDYAYKDLALRLEATIGRDLRAYAKTPQVLRRRLLPQDLLRFAKLPDSPAGERIDLILSFLDTVLECETPAAAPPDPRAQLVAMLKLPENDETCFAYSGHGSGVSLDDMTKLRFDARNGEEDHAPTAYQANILENFVDWLESAFPNSGAAPVLPPAKLGNRPSPFAKRFGTRTDQRYLALCSMGLIHRKGDKHSLSPALVTLWQDRELRAAFRAWKERFKAHRLREMTARLSPETEKFLAEPGLPASQAGGFHNPPRYVKEPKKLG